MPERERERDGAAPGGGDALRALAARGLVAARGGRYRTTRRFQAAMMRACAALMARGDPGDDLRVPVARALTEIFEDQVSNRELARLVEAMVAIELFELGGAP